MSKALGAYRRLCRHLDYDNDDYMFNGDYEEDNEVIENALKDYEILKKDLDRLEKLENVIEIFNDMGIKLEHYPKSKNHPYVLKIKAFGDDLFFDLVNEIRYNLLKEVLGNVKN